MKKKIVITRNIENCLLKDENGVVFAYWWENMRPSEVFDEMVEIYKAAYKAGLEASLEGASQKDIELQEKIVFEEFAYE